MASNLRVDAASLRQYKKKYNFFETPSPIAAIMADYLDGLGFQARVIDPEAGMGSLLRAVTTINKQEYVLDYCELQEEFHPYLTAYNKVGDDFMAYQPGPVYDAVIMNPPYKNNLAQVHTDHAWNCLKPGGMLITLVGKNGADYLWEEYLGHIYDSEVFKKGFKETTVDTFLFLMHKPRGKS